MTTRTRLPLYILMIQIVTLSALTAPYARAVNPAPWVRPKLVVVVSVDQLPYDSFTGCYGFLDAGGLKRLVQEGSLFTDANYHYASTYTGPGHAVQLTGAYGYRNGIVGNKMYVRALKESIDPVSDPQTKVLGTEKPTAGSSPVNLLGNTVGDELCIATGFRAKVVTLALKDRASVFLGGKLGKAYWFDESAGRFVTSTYYHKALPDWVQAFNDRKIPQGDFGKVWERKGPADAFLSVTEDESPWEANSEGLGKSFPHKITGSDNQLGKSYYAAWSHTPLALRAEFELVRSAIQSERLGQDDVPDLLGIGLTPTDHVGHSFGPHSQEMASMMFEVDGFVRDLLVLLDQEVGAGHYVLTFTSDHGACPVPEYMRTLGFDAGRVKKKLIKEVVHAALNEKFGTHDWVVALEDPSVTLDTDLITSLKLNPTEVENVAAAALRKLQGVAAVYTRTQLLNGNYPLDPLTRAVARSFHPERSGDVLVITKPFWFWGKYGEEDHGSTHGSPYTYDTHVPLIFFGAPFRPGVYSERVELIDLAPTLSHLLALTAPSLSEGRVLTEALKRVTGATPIPAEPKLGK